jgi:SulP family sulfate permease
MIAILEAHRVGMLRREQWVPNIIAGIIVGVVALPLSMAFAIAIGAKPEQGLYGAIVGGLLVSVFGGSRVQIHGTTGALVPVLAGIVAAHGIEGLQLAMVMAGVILIAMGLLQMGAIIRFIPAPVIVGFTAGTGVIIWIGQWPAFFGLPTPEGDRLHQRLPDLIRSFGEIDLATTTLGIIGLLTMVYAPRLPGLHRVPGSLVALLLVTAIQSTVAFGSVATIGSKFGGIPTGSPSFSLPGVSPDLLIALLGPALTIAMLVAIESLLAATVADNMAGTQHNSNQELTGQGLSNAAIGLLGGIAGAGAIARTTTNIRNGGTSPLAGITHSLLLLAVVMAFAPLASSIPLVVLAAILFVVAWNMCEAKHFVRMVRRAPVSDVAILVSTFLLTVFTDLLIAVIVGVLLAALHFLRRMASSVDVLPVNDIHLADGEIGYGRPRTLPEGVLVYSIDGPFFFAAVDAFDRALEQTPTDPNVLVIRLNRVPFIDITGLHAIEGAIDDVSSRGVRVILCEANPRVKSKLARAGVIGPGLTLHVASLLEAIDAAGSTLSDPEPVAA